MKRHPVAQSVRTPAGAAPSALRPDKLSSIGDRLGLPDLHGSSGLVVAMLIDSLGSGAFLPFAVLYATVIAHIAVATTGLVLSLCAGFALPTAPIAGALVDRYGAQRVVVAANLAQGLGFAGYPFINSPVALFACGLMVAVGSQGYYAANGSFVALIARPDQRARWYALLGACRSAGVGAGALLSGVAVLLLSEDGYRLLAAANALSFVVAAILIARMALPGRREASAASPERAVRGAGSLLAGYLTVLRDRPFLGFTATNVLFSLISLSFSVVLPLYILGPLGLPIWAPGVIFGANTALTVVAQTPIARWNERFRRTRALAWAAGLFGVALLLFAGLAVFPRDGGGRLLLALVLGVALLVYTIATLVMAPLKNALITDAAPDALRGRYLAFYHLSWSLASTIGPAALTALYAVGASWVWLALSGVAAFTILSMLRLDRTLPLHAIHPALRRETVLP